MVIMYGDRTGSQQLGSRWALPGTDPACWTTAQCCFPNPIFSQFPECGRHSAKHPGSLWQLRFQRNPGTWDIAQPATSGLRCPYLSPDSKVPYPFHHRAPGFTANTPSIKFPPKTQQQPPPRQVLTLNPLLIIDSFHVGWRLTMFSSST